MKFVGATGVSGLWALEWAWHIRVTNFRCVRLRNINLRSHFSICDSFRDIRVHMYDFFEVCGRFVGVNVGVANFLVQSRGIDENNTFQLKFLL